MGVALTLLWPVVADAQNQQDCANAEQLVKLAFDDFPGMHGSLVLKTDLKNELLALKKPAPGYKSCRLYVPSSLRDDSPTLICDLMKSFDIAPLKGVQTKAIIKNWSDTLESVASDIGKCLAVKPAKSIPSKAKEGYEAENWHLFVERPQQSRYAEVAVSLVLTQPKEGIAFDESHKVKAELWVERRDKKKILDTLPTRPPARLQAADFQEFIGLRMADGIDAVQKIYGEPLEVETYKVAASDYRFYKYAARLDGIRFRSDKDGGALMWIHLSSVDTLYWLRRRGASDPKVNLLGLHRDEVIARLGQPDSVDSGDHYNWKAEVAGKTVLVTLRCNDTYGNRCTEMRVGWF